MLVKKSKKSIKDLEIQSLTSEEQKKVLGGQSEGVEGIIEVIHP